VLLTTSGQRPQFNNHLHTVAGIEEPPSYVNEFDQPGSWLLRLAEERTRIQCEMVHRRRWMEDTLENQSAICRIYYRPGGEFFRKDLASSLVRYGRASVLTSGSLFAEQNDLMRPKLLSSNDVRHLRNDAKYMDTLQRQEYESIKESLGMWADPEARASKKDVVEEVEYQTKATIFRKVWNWIRGRR